MTRQNVRAKARGLGAELADLRKQAGLNLRDVSARLGWSPPTISRIENGKRDTPPEQVAALLVVYKITGARHTHLVELARTVDQSGWWETDENGLSCHMTALCAFESEASKLTDVAMILVPGMLQTPEYARATMEAAGADQIDNRVAVRLRRQEILARRNPPEFHAIIDELVLRRLLGSAGVMAAQLRALVHAAAKPHITVQVLPCGGHRALTGSYYEMEFPPPAQPFILLENLMSSSFVDEPPVVRTFQATTDTLTRQALDPMRSQEFLAHLARRYESEAGRSVHERVPAGMA